MMRQGTLGTASSGSGAASDWCHLVSEAASDLIAVLDSEGRRVYANPAWNRFRGTTESLAGSQVLLDIHPEDRAAVAKELAEIFAGGVVRRAEHRLRFAGGEVRYFESQFNGIADPGGGTSLAVMISRDLSARPPLEDAARMRAVQLEEAESIANLGSWVWDVRNGRIWWSDQLRQIFGVDQSHQPTLESFLDSVHPDDRAAMVEGSNRAAESGLIYDQAYRIVRPDGSVRTLVASGRMERDAENRATRLLGVCVDISDRAWTEAQANAVAERLRAVSRRLTEVQESERQLLARELHDRAGQSLTALGLNLKLVATKLAARSSPALSAQVEACMGLVQETVDAMRDVIGELRPQVLDDYGLLAALRMHAKVLAARTGMRVAVVGDDGPSRLPKAVELAMFRIAQEALNNVVKHAQATVVEVSYAAAGSQRVLSLLDDGVGFDLAQSVNGGRQGWGLRIMRERAESVGARFHVETAPGRGAMVVVEYPD